MSKDRIAELLTSPEKINILLVRDAGQRHVGRPDARRRCSKTAVGRGAHSGRHAEEWP